VLGHLVPEQDTGGQRCKDGQRSQKSGIQFSRHCAISSSRFSVGLVPVSGLTSITRVAQVKPDVNIFLKNFLQPRGI
jgi:hypothetical protein